MKVGITRDVNDYVNHWKFKLIVCGIALVSLVIMIIYLYCNHKSCYFPIFLILLFIFEIINNTRRMNNFKKIQEHLIENGLEDKVGKIEICNNIDYVIAENWMIIVVKGKVFSFSYTDIERIVKKAEYRFHPNYSYQEYITVVLKNGKFFRLLSYSTDWFGQKNIDLAKHLLEKNIEIIVQEEKPHIRLLK